MRHSRGNELRHQDHLDESSQVNHGKKGKSNSKRRDKCAPRSIGLTALGIQSLPDSAPFPPAQLQLCRHPCSNFGLFPRFPDSSSASSSFSRFSEATLVFTLCFACLPALTRTEWILFWLEQIHFRWISWCVFCCVLPDPRLEIPNRWV